MFKKIHSLIKDWAEVTILLPTTLLFVLFGKTALYLIDPTAAILDVGTLTILGFNLLCLSLIYGVSYLIYKINFGDFFAGEWAAKLSPWVAVVANLALWLSTLLISSFILLRNL